MLAPRRSEIKLKANEVVITTTQVDEETEETLSLINSTNITAPN